VRGDVVGEPYEFWGGLEGGEDEGSDVLAAWAGGVGVLGVGGAYEAVDGALGGFAVGAVACVAALGTYADYCACGEADFAFGWHGCE
jgi:hypothetical protein